MRRYYQILGVSPTASPQEIKEAWLFSLKAFHPDKFADASRHQQAVAEARTQAINEAFRVLSDPVSRAVYDRDYFRESSYENKPATSAKAIPRPVVAADQKARISEAPLRPIAALLRRKALASYLILISLFLLVGGLLLVWLYYPARSQEPPFTQIVVPSIIPTPAIVPTTPDKVSVISPRVFDLPKLASVARKAIGLVMTFDTNGKPIGTGSGFFISADGRFVTNEHVIRGAKRTLVKMENGALYPVVRELRKSSRFDLALVQTTAREVSFLELETSGVPQVGTRIAVIGSPETFEGTLSDGIVSAIRTEGNGTWIQITAPISPGSSGSPVLNAEGHVIGVATLTFGQAQNLNFARSAMDLIVLNQSVDAAAKTAMATGAHPLDDTVQPPAPPSPTPSQRFSPSPSSTPAQSLTPTPNTQVEPVSPTPSQTPDATPPSPSMTYRVTGLPKRTPFLNIRVGPGANFAVIGVFTPKGRGITLGPGRVTNGDTVWQEVFSGDFHGWVNAQYLSPETNAEKPSGDSLAAPKTLSPQPQRKARGGHN